MKILLVHDGSTNSDTIFEDLPRAGLPGNAEAVVLTAVDTDERREAVATTLEAAHQIAAKATAILKEQFPGWKVAPVALEGTPATSILEWAHNWSPDLLIAGTHGRSPLRRLFLGSVSLALVQRAECSVRVVRSGFPGRNGPIHLVLGTDGSPQAEAAVHGIATRVWPPETEVLVVAALDPENSSDEDALASAGVFRKAETGRKRLQTAAEKSAEELNRAGLKASVIVPEGDPCHCLLIEAEHHHADAIFVGGRGLSRLATLFLGSVSARVVRHAHCTVEIVRGK